MVVGVTVLVCAAPAVSLRCLVAVRLAGAADLDGCFGRAQAVGGVWGGVFRFCVGVVSSGGVAGPGGVASFGGVVSGVWLGTGGGATLLHV